MSKIKFITDSASDISVEDERSLDIQVIPFPVAFGEQSYLSRVDFDNEKFYEMLEAAPEIPTTSQITVYQYGEIFEAAFAQGYTDVINVTINSEGSGTYNSACLAAQMFFETHPEVQDTFHIYNIDGQSYSCGYGYPVVEAARRAQQGESVEALAAFINDWLEHCVIYFVPYTLKYAGKSGRIPSAAAFIGELVGLKPIMRIHDHVIVTDDKVRGEKKIIPTVAKKVVADIESGSPYVVVYGSHPEDGEAMAKAMTEALGYPPAGFTQIGAAIAINAGPRVVGVALHGK